MDESAIGEKGPPEPSHPEDNHYRLREQRQQLGLLGRIFGGREHAPIAIIGLTTLISVVALALSSFLDFDAGMKEIFKAIILLAVGALASMLAQNFTGSAGRGS